MQIERANVGRIAERIAMNELEARGYHIIDLAYMSKTAANVDFIASKGGQSFHVQVKGMSNKPLARWAVQYGYCDEAAACDVSCALRLAAATRLERVTGGTRLRLDRAAMPTRYQRIRLVQFLALHDALEAGASARDLTFGLVFLNHRPLSGAIWKGSGERRHVLRLIADARRLVEGGYRNLLRHC